jgi:8-oxo-dGTP pyrophosphatase MutT (NUDIX family)
MGLSIDREHSAGGVVVRDGEVLLISVSGGRWQLPKGRLERGETAAEAALREVAEETGVRGRLRQALPAIDYWFTRPGARVHKQVDYFLLDYASGSSDDHDPEEVEVAAWFGWEEAIARLAFANERRVVEAARRVTGEVPVRVPGERGVDG